MIKVFEETLYGQTKSGGVYEWKITVEPRYEDAVNIIVTRGLLNGKKTKSCKVIKKGIPTYLHFYNVDRILHLNFFV